METQQRSPRLRRAPERLRKRFITPLGFRILRYIAAYRYLVTSHVTALAGGDPRTVADHLYHFYHRGVLNRFQMTRNGEFIYYIDSIDTLRLLAEAGCDLPDQTFEWVRTNRDTDYASAARRQDPGPLLFIEHELMISRFHAALELACFASGGAVELVSFRQGSVLHNRVRVPKLSSDGQQELFGPNATQLAPHRPDAAFTLRITATGNVNSFFYEADRRTTSIPRFRQKLRSHFHFVVKQRLHEKHYGVVRVRSVLIETIDSMWAENLREAARHPSVSGPKPSPLFWFVPSSVFARLTDAQFAGRVRQVPLFLTNPEIIFRPMWATPVNDEFHSLLD